jgi:tetratricopeptide (TPR) repeat protein
MALAGSRLLKLTFSVPARPLRGAFIFLFNIAGNKAKVMKTQRVLIFFLFLSAGAFAQSKGKTSAAPVEKPRIVSPDFDLDLYRKAISFGDYDIAKAALFNLVVRHPDSLNYLDSLVTLYFSLGQLPQCIYAGNQYLLHDSANLSVMEMVALSYSQLNKNKESLEIYEKMFRQTGNIYYAYQTAVQQFYLKRIGECNQMIEIIVKDPKSSTEKIAINVDQATQQHVPLKAAALNMRGIIFKEMNMADKAKAAFEESLQVMPDFTLAKGNLDLLAKPAEQKNDVPANGGGEEKKK